MTIKRFANLKIKNTLTPMMNQYSRIKKNYPDCILFFRMGDFYEMFFEDAKVASKELEITLTARSHSKGEKAPMCGVPFHSADSYINRLISKGFKVAICEQVEEASKAKGLVKREVIKVVTPGTVLDTGVLDAKENNFLASFYYNESDLGIAFVDVSTGEFTTTQISAEKGLEEIFNTISAFQPSELIYPSQISLEENIKKGIPSTLLTPLEDWIFSHDYCYPLLLEHFQTSSLAGFGLEDFPAAISAAGGLLHYLQETQKATLKHIDSISYYNSSEYMILDKTTQQNLELIKTLRDGSRQRSLLGIIDKCCTSMGSRRLKAWLLQPLRNKKAIIERIDAVEKFYHDTILRSSLRNELKKIQDIERSLSKISLGSGNARDMLLLSNSFNHVPDIKSLLKETNTPLIKNLYETFDELKDIKKLISNSIAENPPISLREGGIIKSGYNAQLDELREISKSSKGVIARMEQEERKRTGISSLKVRFNQVFGYYIEVSKANLAHVPSDYIRKQTLVNAERFITPQLKEYEAKVLGAEERITQLEYELFQDIRSQVAAEASRIKNTAHILALLDVLSALAELAVNNNYCHPIINEGEEIKITDGRHPVVEKLNLEEKFIPNDTYLNTDSHRLLIITGPNMGGKSTYLRQVALICILAQMGSFVPAKAAEIGIVDRIFTRVGASDSIITGQSTFLVEMNEAANILHNAAKKSLILLDEIGRGTSTFDGISIAWAVAEYIHNQPRIGSKTLFATHYHELTDLALTLSGVKNYNIAVREWQDKIIFLRKVVEGGSDKSYGIHVARLAGLPQQVIERAKEILSNLEKNEFTTQGEPKLAIKAKGQKNNKSVKPQLSLFDDYGYPLIEELKKIDLNSLTPLEALELLNKWKKDIL
jgi:DNA mismatch repair protein MutS